MALMTNDEVDFIRRAEDFFENDSVLMRMANAIGKPASFIQKALPGLVQKGIVKAVDKSLQAALQTAFKTLKDVPPQDITTAIQSSRKSRTLHGTMAAGSGAVGGFFGGPGMVVELPVTTTIMMRNIAAIANEFGFSKTDPQTALECLYVFSLGTRAKTDDDFDSAYYTSRMAMAAALRNSAQYIASSGTKAAIDSLRKGASPIVINLLSRVAAYFEIVVSEKLVAGAIPVIGSAGAAAVNLAFTDYFGQAAQYHFGLLALERKYGQEAVQKIYSYKKSPGGS